MATALRSLTLGELLDRVFFLYRRHFLLVVGIVALPHLLVLALQITSLLLQDNLILRALLLLIVVCVSVVVMVVSQAATVIAVSAIHLERPITIGEAFAAIQGRVWELIVITVAVGLATFAGFLLLIVPGVLLLLRWSLVVPVAVLERESLGVSMTRSSTLTEGHRGRLFMIYFLYFVLTLAFQSAIQMPIMIGAFVASGGNFRTIPLSVQIMIQAASYITQSLVGPLLTITLALVYYDERVRKEAFDLEHMMAELDRGTDAPATA